MNKDERRSLKKYKHQVTVEQKIDLGKDWFGISFESDFLSLHDCILTIRIGYAWDGASGPVFQTDALIDASVYHDALYQVLRGLILIEELRSRLQLSADELLRDEYLRICMEQYTSNSWRDKLSIKLAKTRAKYIFWAVQKFGKKRTLANG
jgi:hypothetical protein